MVEHPILSEQLKERDLIEVLKKELEDIDKGLIPTREDFELIITKLKEESDHQLSLLDNKHNVNESMEWRNKKIINIISYVRVVGFLTTFSSLAEKSKKKG